MTIILSSDRKSTRSLGNIFGIKGPLDYDALLDFNSGIYRYRENGALIQTALSDALNFTRASVAEYRDNNGARRIAQVNVPRIHTFADLGVSGLLLESRETNLLTNPDAPATQTIMVAGDANASRYLVLSVEGSGSATMVVPNATAHTPGPAVQGSAQGARMERNATPVPVTVTVTGALTRFKLTNRGTSTGAGFDLSPLPVGVTTREQDNAFLSDLYLNAAVSGTVGTVVANFVDSKTTGLDSLAGRACFSLADTTRPKGGVYVGRTTEVTLNFSSVTPSTSASQLVFNMAAPTVRRTTVVAGYDAAGGKANITINGLTETRSSVFAMNQPNKMTLGTPDGYSTSQGSANGVLARLLIFKRLLTQEEITAVSTSWNT